MIRNDNDEKPANVPSEGVVLPYNIESDSGFGDPNQLLNMRYWLQAAIEAKGGQQIGAGFGMGEADIDFELEGHNYNVVIKPIIS